MKNFYTLVLSSLFTGCLVSSFSQEDVGTISIELPNGSGCDMTSEVVRVTIRNFDSDNLFGPFNINYKLDNGPTVTETDMNLLGFAGGSTRSYTFNTPMNLANNYGEHTLYVFTSLVGDANMTNDTGKLVFYNYAPTDGGILSSTDTICAFDNSDTLFLNNHVGNVVEWQFNNGLGWIPIAVTDSFYVYNDLNTTTNYRVIVKNGTCPSAISNEITIKVDTPASAGNLSEDAIICYDNNGGVLEIDNYYGNISNWQINSGSGWSNINHYLDTLAYSKPSQTTLYRVLIDTNNCGIDTSNVITLSVETIPNGGSISSSNSVCLGNNLDTLVLSNHIGNILRWEQSTDGFIWTPISSTDTFLIYANISIETHYRVVVQTGSCTPIFSDTATIQVVEAANAGVLSENQTICNGASSDTLYLNSYFGSILKWQLDSGNGWVDIMNTSDQLAYHGLNNTTAYRVIVDTGICGPDTSNTVTISVVAATEGGNIIGSDSVCVGANYDTLTLTNHVGNIIEWQISDDEGISWSSINNNNTTQVYSNLNATRWYRALLEASNCSSQFSDTAIITTVGNPQAGFIDGDKSFCGTGNSDTLLLNSYQGNILKWQANDTSGWKDIMNTSDTLIVSNLNISTSYRTLVGNNYCTNDTTAAIRLEVIPATKGGNLLFKDSICSDLNQDTIQLSNHVGDVSRWESSTNNGLTWNYLSNSDTFLIYNNLNQTTWYRVLIDGANCSNEFSDTAMIVPYTPTLTISSSKNTTFCEGDSTILSCSNGLVNYSWNTGDSNSSITVKSTGLYHVSAEDHKGCLTNDSIYIISHALPLADAGNDVMIDLGETTLLEGQGGTSCIWSPGIGLTITNTYSVEATPNVTTIYYLTVTDDNGCKNTDSVKVEIARRFVLGNDNNIITPNGDGKNDQLYIGNLSSYPDCELIIMNRYGTVIYQTKGYQNTWDGTIDGKKVPDGTYYYVVSSQEFDKTYNGSITVLSK